MIGIYAITNTITGCRYIGQSHDIESRWRSHLSHLKNNSHDNTHLQNSFNKCGEFAFKFEVLEWFPFTDTEYKKAIRIITTLLIIREYHYMKNSSNIYNVEQTLKFLLKGEIHVNNFDKKFANENIKLARDKNCMAEIVDIINKKLSKSSKLTINSNLKEDKYNLFGVFEYMDKYKSYDKFIYIYLLKRDGMIYYDKHYFATDKSIKCNYMLNNYHQKLNTISITSSGEEYLSFILEEIDDIRERHPEYFEYLKDKNKWCLSEIGKKYFKSLSDISNI